MQHSIQTIWPVQTISRIFSRIFVSACFVLLAGCATQPSGTHQFSLTAGDAKSSQWTLKNLSGHGRIDLAAHLLADGSAAAEAIIRLGLGGMETSQVSLQLADPSCSGVYRMRALHKENARSELVDYFRTGVRWEDPLILEIEWSADGHVSLKLGGSETRAFQLEKPIKDFMIDIAQGGMNVDSLVYTRIEE